MKKLVILTIAVLFLAISCGEKQSNAKPTDEKATTEEVSADPLQDKGVGPIKSLKLPDTIDEAMAKTGEEVYAAKCTACHKVDKKYIGPSPIGILERRSPEWIMNMILNPEVMILENEIAKKLLMEYNGAPMANQNLTEEEARAILEYFRTIK